MSISTGDELFYESGPIMARGQADTETVTIDKIVSRRYFTILFDQQIVDRSNKTEMGSILNFDSNSLNSVSILIPNLTSQSYNTIIPVFYGPSTQTFTPTSGLNVQSETFIDDWSFYYISNGSDYSPRRYKLVFDKVDQNFRLYINNVLYGTGTVTLVDSLSQTKIYSMFVKCNDSFSDSPYTEVRGISIAEFSNLQDAIDYDGSSIPANTYVTVDPSTSTNWRKTIYRDYRTTWGRVGQSLYVPCDCTKVTSQYFSIDADVMLGYGYAPGQSSPSFSSIWFRRGINGVGEVTLFSMDTSSNFNMGEAMRYVGYIAAPATAGTATMNSDHVKSYTPYSNTQYMRWGIDSGPATYRYGTYLWKAFPDGYNPNHHIDQTRLQWHRLRIVFTTNTKGTIFLDGNRLGDFTTDASVKSIVDIRIWNYYSGIANLCIREYSSSTYALSDNGRDRMLMYPTSTSNRYITGIAESAADEVTIGSQTWMSKNLAIDDGQGGIYTQTVNYGQGNVTEYYYTWEAAVRVAATVQGWHLPTTAEWDTLATYVGGTDVAGTKLKSTTGWSSGNGTDDFGFSALPAGRQIGGSFYNLGSNAYFWTANESSSLYGYNRYFDTAASMYSSNSYKTYRYSVRLVKD